MDLQSALGFLAESLKYECDNRARMEAILTGFADKWLAANSITHRPNWVKGEIRYHCNKRFPLIPPE